MKISLRRQTFLSLFAILTLIACEEKKQLTDMHDTTMAMGQTTNNMSKTTDELYDASKQGATSQLRRDGLNAISSARSYGKKISEAAQYFMSFEFQLWQGAGQDLTNEKRTKLLKDATAEFFKSIQEFYNDDPAISFFAKPDSLINQDSDNREASFNAIAVTLHCLNRKQEEMLVNRPDQKPISMLSIIEDALVTETDLNSNKKNLQDVPEYIQEVLNNKPIAVKLLQARQGFLPMLFLAKVSPIKSGLLSAGEMVLSNWNFNIDELNVSQLAELQMILKASLEARSFLENISIPAQKSSVLDRMFRNMKISTVTVNADNERSAARIKLMNLIEQIR